MDYITLDKKEFSEGELVSIEVLKRMPDLLVTYNPKVDFGIESAVEIWDKNTECENCSKKGCYILRDDRSGIGVCRKELEEEAKTTKKTIIKVLELPIGHKY